MDTEGPSLDELLEKEAEAAENLSKAFIRFSLARNDVQNALRDLRKDFPNRFGNEWDVNETPYNQKAD